MSKVTKEVTVDLSELVVKVNKCVDEFNKAIDNAFKKDNDKVYVRFYNMVDGSQHVLIEGYEGKHFFYNHKVRTKGNKLCMVEQEGNLRINYNNLCYTVERLIDKDNLLIVDESHMFNQEYLKR